ncbi:hypothetical protein BFW01_g6939 [Lasiodiplodia theobromae]|nr:hypothetical protein BFW01_g6939 [Lasiodiplodia theobromae]
MDATKPGAPLQETHEDVDALFVQIKKNLEGIRDQFPGFYDKVKILVATMDPHAGEEPETNHSSPLIDATIYKEQRRSLPDMTAFNEANKVAAKMIKGKSYPVSFK